MTPDSPDLAINLGGLAMKNPVTVASGTFGYGQEFSQYFDVAALGAVTTKSLSREVRAGNKPPRIVETAAGMLNAIGLQNVGIETYLAEKLPWLRENNATIIANIVGKTLEDYVALAERLEAADGADAIEANLSCPNVHDARRALGATMVSQVPDQVRDFTKALKAATRLPVYIKLTPNVMDIREPAKAAEEGGADGLCLINTLQGMAIDAESRRPKLANITGGLSGPCIKPVALKMVWDAARAVRIPIIGTGGICTAADAIEFLLAGATAVSVGTFSFRQPDAALHVINGLREYLARHGHADVSELVGALRLDP